MRTKKKILLTLGHVFSSMALLAALFNLFVKKNVIHSLMIIAIAASVFMLLLNDIIFQKGLMEDYYDEMKQRLRLEALPFLIDQRIEDLVLPENIKLEIHEMIFNEYHKIKEIKEIKEKNP